MKGGTEDNDCKWVKPSADATHWSSLQGSSYHKQNSSLCHWSGCWSFSIVAPICYHQISHLFLRSTSYIKPLFLAFSCLPLSHTEPLNNAALSSSGRLGCHRLHFSLKRGINLHWGCIHIEKKEFRIDMKHLCILDSKACMVMQMKAPTFHLTSN